MDITGLIDKLLAFLPPELQEKAKGARKALVAGIGALLTALTLTQRFNFLVPEKYQKQVATAISLLTAALTYLTPNEPASLEVP